MAYYGLNHPQFAYGVRIWGGCAKTNLSESKCPLVHDGDIYRYETRDKDNYRAQRHRRTLTQNLHKTMCGLFAFGLLHSVCPALFVCLPCD
ncbi:hypothetical protein J6590_062258 [Homalodisca vitripennis]|nr:hypothetical protein J6590_062258 [Homalodisca vitripennis]